MRIVTWNVNGVKNPFSYSPWCTGKRNYEQIFTALSADIICIQELKAQTKELDSCADVKGLDRYITIPRSKKGYSGVCVFNRFETCRAQKAEEGVTGFLPVTSTNQRRSYVDLPDSERIEGRVEIDRGRAQQIDSEGRALLLDFRLFVLIGVYCPAVSVAGRDTFRLEFLEALEDRVRTLIAAKREVILVGDINVCRDVIDSADPRGMSKGSDDGTFKGFAHRRWLDRMLLPHRLGCLIDTTRHFQPKRRGMYTCWNTKINARPGNYGTRIDYCLASKGLLKWLRYSDTMNEIMGSDHCPVFLDFHDSIEEDGHKIYLIDQLFPEGTFVNGVQVVPKLPLPPPLSSHHANMRNCNGSIAKMFAKAAHKGPAKPPSQPEPVFASQSDDGVAIQLVDDNTEPRTLSQISDLERSPTGIGKLEKAYSQRGIDSDISDRPSQDNNQSSLIADTITENGKRKNETPYLPAENSRNKAAKKTERNDDNSKPQKTLYTLFCDKAAKDCGEKFSYDQASGSSCKDYSQEKEPCSDSSVAMHPSEAADGIECASHNDRLHRYISNLEKNEDSTVKWNSLFTRPVKPRCTGHNEDCVELITKKPGANQGRRFWICARPVGPGSESKNGAHREVNEFRCSFFKWSSDVKSGR